MSPDDRTADRHTTPRRIISAADDLWADYGKVCAEEGTNRAADLRSHMVRRVKAWRRAQKAAAAE